MAGEKKAAFSNPVKNRVREICFNVPLVSNLFLKTYFTFRAWTDSAYLETQYVLLDIPKLGTHPVAIVTLKDENVVNLRFPVLSSDRNSKSIFIY